MSNGTRDRKREESQTARELGEMFSGQATEYFSEDDTPTSQIVAINPKTPLPLAKPRKKLMDYASEQPSTEPRTEFSHSDLPMYLICQTGIGKHYLKYGLYPKAIYINKSKFQELITGIVYVHKEPFRPNYMPFTYSPRSPRCEYIPIFFNSNLSDHTVICT